MEPELLVARNGHPVTKREGPIKLNLGGRDQKIEGFLTVDLYPGSDVESDISKLPFEDGTVSEIYASHCLEHFSHRRTISVLQEWNRVLKKGAKAYIGVPDFEAAVKLYSKIGLTDLINNFLWGDQEYDLAFHYSGFTFSTLASSLVKSGFNDVKRMQNLPYRLPDCSTLRDTKFNLPLSLNVMAVK